MEHSKLWQSFAMAIILSVTFLTGWELYWRSIPDYYHANIDDDRNLWAEHRAKVETATKDDVVILGASRTGFGFRTSLWQEIQGIAPINLSVDGKTPVPFLVDIVDNTSFNGTIILGVAILPVFASTEGSHWWAEAAAWPEHYRKQTYASKLSFFLSKQLQSHLVMLTSSELDFYNDLDLKSLIKRIPWEGRAGPGFPLLKFGYNDYERNLIMFTRMTKDPESADVIKDVWSSIFVDINLYKDEIMSDAVAGMTALEKVVKKFEARGGNTILTRHDAQGIWEDVETSILPRELVWDKFVDAVDSPTYHYADYEFMGKYILPEWSHLSDSDAYTYTHDMVNKMIEDGHLVRH